MSYIMEPPIKHIEHYTTPPEMVGVMNGPFVPRNSPNQHTGTGAGMLYGELRYVEI